MPHAHRRAIASAPSRSLLRMSAFGRLGLAAVVASALWLGVIWAWS